MSIAPIGSQALPAIALGGLAHATSRIQDSIQRISTGSRFANAGDDVSTQSVASKLQTRITSLRQALLNTTQADSLLEIAFGGLGQITDILSNMQAIATQSNSASLSSSERQFLDQEFQQLSAEIDRIANETSFNGVKLLDGSVNDENAISQNTSQATRATASLTFAVNPGAGQTVRINNTVFTANTNFAIGGTINATLLNLRDALNQSTNTNISQASYEVVGNTLNITHDSGGTLGNQFVINQNTSTAAFTTVGGLTPTANLFTAQGGTNDGLYFTSVKASGTIGDSLVNTQAQVSATQSLNFTGNPAAGNTIQIDNGAGGFVTFTFAAVPVATTDIGIGATMRESLQNAVSVINNYSGNNDYGTRQIEVLRNNDNLVFTYKGAGNALDATGAAFNLAETVPGTLSGAILNNGANTGVNVDGVNNEAFVGSVSGFSATFAAADSVTAQITVGGETYSATITDTTPAANSTVRFNSANGGYFDVQFASVGQAVADQDDADLFANRLDAAFSGLNFYQSRLVTNFNGTGQLAGASLEIQLDDFADVTLEDISVTPPPGAGLDATIDVTINGETFRSPANLGGDIGDRETIRLTSIDDANRFITFRAGAATIDISNGANADQLESDLKDALGFGTGGGALSFQVGSTPGDTLQVRISGVTTQKLFGGQSLDVLTQTSAGDAFNVLDDALNQVASITADVGAYQSRFSYASGNLANSITYTDEARSALADTDIASEATNFALAQLQANSAIAVLTQINGLSSNLLQLLQGKG